MSFNRAGANDVYARGGSSSFFYGSNIAVRCGGVEKMLLDTCICVLAARGRSH
jgi:hypothetical protein